MSPDAEPTPATTAPSTHTSPTATSQTSSHRAALFATVIAMLLGSGITVLLHEGAHWVTGAALGHPSRLYAAFVTHDGTPSPTDVALMALAGPAFSLVLGLVMTFWLPLRRPGGVRGLGHLLWVWIGFTSLQEAVTYLVITPFGVGDTAVAVEALGGGAVAALVMMAVGIAGMFWQARRFAVHLRRWAGDDLGLARSYAWYPWLIAAGWSVVVQLAMLPLTAVPTLGESVVIALAGFSITVFAPMAFIFLRRTAQPSEPLTLPPVPIGPLVGYAVLLAVNVVLTLTGPRLGG